MHSLQTLFTRQEMYKSAIILCLLISCASAGSVSVTTNVGTIVGQTNDGYDTYFGIPYSKVDENNPFGNGQPYPNFVTSFVANDSSIICPQAVFEFSNTLQCLRLNIYVPHKAKCNNKLPILFWIHGGANAFGSGGQFGGQHLVKRDIIVITINYRLGPYGFLCLNDPTVPGNQGMKDQIDALRWVKKNIAAFGGDPNKVTITGESYGGAAVDLHLYSEYETLFDKAIVQSGSIFYEGFYVKSDWQAAIKLAQYLGHNVTESKKALRVLANEDAQAVMSAALYLNLPMSVCKERRFTGVKNFLTQSVFHLNNVDRIKKTKIMIGITSMEQLATFANQPIEFWDTLGDVFAEKIKQTFSLPSYEYAILSNILRKFYLRGKPIGPEYLLELSEFLSDLVVNHAVERSVDNYMRAGADASVYKYVFSYIGGSPYKSISGSGAPHTEELKYLFEWQSPISGDEQMMIRNRTTALWANFVKFGNPTPEKTKLLPVTWTPVQGTSRPYLNIDVELSMRDHVYHRRMAFWDLLWHYYGKKVIVDN